MQKTQAALVAKTVDTVEGAIIAANEIGYPVRCLLFIPRGMEWEMDCRSAGDVSVHLYDRPDGWSAYISKV